MKRNNKGTIFLMLGLLCILGAIGLTFFNQWDSRRAQKASEEVEVQLEELITDEAQTDIISSPTMTLEQLEGNRDMATMEIDGNLYIGILEIPSLNIKLPVMDDWDYDKLKIAPCRYSGSYYQDDLVIAAHNYSKHFSPIKWIEPYSDVYFVDAEGGVHEYQVDYIENVKPTEINKMITGDWDLTLFTCTTGGQTRCAVRCYRK